MTQQQYSKFSEIVTSLTVELQHEQRFHDAVNQALVEQYQQICSLLDTHDARLAEICAQVAL